MRERIILTVAGILLACLAAPAWTYAQGAYTIPRSDRTISGELTFPGECKAPHPTRLGRWVVVPCKARFTVRDGTWVTVERHGAGPRYFFGFLGQINESTGLPNFIPFELHRVTPDDTTVNELDKTGFKSPYLQDPSRDIAIGQKKTFSSAMGIKLQVIGTGESIFEAPFIIDASQYSEEYLQKEFGYTASNNCCVSCQGATVCASGVSTSCGTCGGEGGGHGLAN